MIFKSIKRTKNEGSCTLPNGIKISDSMVLKRANKNLNCLDWVFNHRKVVSEILWAHTELLYENQDKEP